MQNSILFIDISLYLQKKQNTGIQRVIKEFILRAMHDVFTLHVIHYHRDQNIYLSVAHSEIHPLFEDIKNYRLQDNKPIDIFQETLSKENQKIFFDIDAVWNTEEKRDELYPKLKRHNYKIINFIYDLIPVLYPHYMYEQVKTNFPPFLGAVYKYSDGVFFDSLSTQKDFFQVQKSYPSTNHIPTHVVYLGSDFTNIAEASPRHAQLQREKYILFVGTIEPRKEQLLALQAFESLHKHDPDIHLVFIGKEGWHAEKFMQTFASHELKQTHIHHFQDIDDTELLHFYKNAFIVLYLSKYEGYGLPLAEALFHKNLIITSNNSSLKEVGQDFAIYLKKNTQAELLKQLLKYTQDAKLYQTKRECISQNYKPHSWDETYQEILEILSTSFCYNSPK